MLNTLNVFSVLLILSPKDKLMFHAHKTKNHFHQGSFPGGLFPDFSCHNVTENNLNVTNTFNTAIVVTNLYTHPESTGFLHHKQHSYKQNMLTSKSLGFPPPKHKHGQKRRNHCHCLHMYKQQCF